MNDQGASMKPTRLLALPALAALAFGFGAAQAQAPGAATSATGGQSAPMAQPGAGTRNSPGKSQVARGDRKFIEEAAGSGMFEVQIGQLAAAKATDQDVKSFASMLVDQHTAANNELTKIANAKGVELPAAPKHALRRDIEKLGKKKNGEEFDRDFVRDVGVKAHKKDIKMFEKASKDVKDADLKAFVDKTLPVLREHLAAAEKLPQSGKNAAAMGANKR
jgi:putative membrane protein